MKEIYNKELDCMGLEPETPLEAVESLEQFLLTTLSMPSGNRLVLKNHFKVCKDQIISLNRKKKKDER